MQITWLGQGGFVFESDGYRMAIDPYLSNSLNGRGFKRMFPPPVSPADLSADCIVCTHDHGDHFDPETVIPAVEAHPQIKVFGPSSVVQHGKKLGLGVEKLEACEKNAQMGPFTLSAVKAYHSDPDAVGLIIGHKGIKIYLTADTLYNEHLTQEAFERGPIDILITCINGKLGNMSGEEALRISRILRPSLIIPMHYGMFASNTVDHRQFVHAAGRSGHKVEVLNAGAPTDISPLLEKNRIFLLPEPSCRRS